jgi:cytochrome c oxidase assembly protein subunit 15
MAVAEPAIMEAGRDGVRGRGAVRIWLYCVALLIVCIVILGGATRLTNSGLSITEWQPIHGVIPPLDAGQWQDEFAKYRQIPEYRILNPTMTLDEFKGIFWWEWAHRLLGRVIAVVFLLPLLFFAATRRIDRPLVPKLAVLFVLGGLQGAIGWWMVASGLAVRTDVSQYRLAIHLTFACVLLAAILWVARGLGAAGDAASSALRRTAGLIVGLVFAQIFLGGIVAGLNAGLASNTWPLMDNAVVPSGLFSQSPFWTNFFENPLTAQFDHRLVAYVVLLTAIVHAFRARRTPHAAGALALVLLIAGQASLGIATIVAGVPLHLAILHQLGAVVVLSFAVVHLRTLGRPATNDMGAMAWTASQPRPT